MIELQLPLATSSAWASRRQGSVIAYLVEEIRIELSDTTLTRTGPPALVDISPMPRPAVCVLAYSVLQNSGLVCSRPLRRERPWHGASTPGAVRVGRYAVSFTTFDHPISYLSPSPEWFRQSRRVRDEIARSHELDHPEGRRVRDDSIHRLTQARCNSAGAWLTP